ncbi:MAG: PAS domain-containing sensor histidine kinase [Pseudomonadota bacterium]
MGRKTSDTTGRGSRTRLPLGWLIALAIVQAIALGLKGWEERQSADLAALALLQRTADTVNARIEGQIDATIAVLDSKSGATTYSAAAAAVSGVDEIMPLSRAARARPNSRLRLAADEALRLGGSDTLFFASPPGDVALVYRPENGQSILAIGPLEDWLPQNAANYAFILTGPGDMASGNGELKSLPVETVSRGHPYFQQTEGFPRAGVACTTPKHAAQAICVASHQPLIGQIDMMRLVIYFLLFLAPMLAIYGLYKSLSGKTKRMRLALKTELEAAHVFDLVLEGAEAGYWETQIDDQKILVSERFGKLIGLDDSRLFSWDDFLETVYEDDREAVRTALQRCQVLGRISVAFRSRHTDGKSWIELTGKQVEDPDDTALRCAGLAADITKRKSIDERLHAAERRLRNALEGYDGPFAIWDGRKRLLYWNSAYAKAFNLSTELRVGMGYDTVVLARAPSIRQEKASAESNTALIQLANGRWINLVERSTPEGGLITVGVDVTETTRSAHQIDRQSKKLKQTLSDLQRSETHAAELAKMHAEEKEKAERAAHSKSVFLANMSHELRTPLNAINGFSEILAKELYGPLGDDRYKGYADDILASGQHLLDMINDILDMAKIESGKMDIRRQSIDPVDPVDAAIRMIGRKAADKNVRLILDAEDDLPEISADHLAIRQMMLNLISNAIKFTDGGGRIAVTIRKRGEFIRFAVSDTGVGISERDLPRLAQPFEQVDNTSNSNRDGTGLGLALTKSFAEMHGGKLSIASQEGRGTTVAFILPIKEQTRAVA